MIDPKKIKVLIVEDSSVVRMLLVHILKSDPNIEIIGTAGNGLDALAFLTKVSPDVILMDVEMPGMNGFETTRQIMETQPVPIIICAGSSSPRESISAFRLMEAGAVACVEKPLGREHAGFDAMAAHLIQTVKLMSEVKVVRRWPRTRQQAPMKQGAITPLPVRAPAAIDVIGIGASTGGPPVLRTILVGLPSDFRPPVLIVQHIAPGFISGLVEWLHQTTGLNVQISSHGLHPMPACVYLAPDDFHMAIGAGGNIVLSKEPHDNGLRPSVAHLFRSLAQVHGAKAVGVLLTGMGKDGALELKLMRDRGATTIVQDRETSVVHGMPAEAISLGAASFVLPADKIGPALVSLVNRQPLTTRDRS